MSNPRRMRKLSRSVRSIGTGGVRSGSLDCLRGFGSRTEYNRAMLHTAGFACARIAVHAALCLFICLPVVTASFAQERIEPSTDLEVLSERVDELKSFRVTYRLHASDGRTGLMHWMYVADDRVRVRMETAGQSRDMFWIADGKLTAGAFDRAGAPYIIGMDVGERLAEYESVHDALDQHFPLAGSAPFGMRVQFNLVLNTTENKTDLSVGIIDRRLSLFSWLSALNGEDQLEQADEKVLVFERNARRYEVSALNGFLTRGWIGAGDDRRLAVELVELELDPEISPSEMEAPQWTGTDEEIDQGLRRAMLNTLEANIRETVLRRLQTLYDQDALTWGENGPTGIFDLLRELHLVATREETATYLEELDTQLAERATNLQVWADEYRESEAMATELEVHQSTARDQLSKSLESIIDAGIEQLESPSKGDDSLEEEFLIVERKALRSALESTLRDAALERFERTVGAVE